MLLPGKMDVYGPGMTLTSSITDYDDRWPHQFDAEAARVLPVFGEACVAIHHVGSRSVKGLAAKPEIDMVVVVSDVAGLDRWQSGLQALGYRRGSDLTKGHHFFKWDIGKIRTHKVHVCATGHPQIERMLKIRDRLRANGADRTAYADLKRRLEQENTTGIAEYLKGKAPFLDDLYHKIQDSG